MRKDTEDEEFEKQVKKTAKMLDKELGLTKIKERMFGERPSLARKIYTEVDISNPKTLTGKTDRILGWFKALIQEDKIALKALSEGTASDGGYLVPDEVSSEIVKSLTAPTRMRGLVRNITMNRDTLKVPKLGSRPHVRYFLKNLPHVKKLVNSVNILFNRTIPSQAIA